MSLRLAGNCSITTLLLSGSNGHRTYCSVLERGTASDNVDWDRSGRAGLYNDSMSQKVLRGMFVDRSIYMRQNPVFDAMRLRTGRH